MKTSQELINKILASTTSIENADFIDHILGIHKDKTKRNENEVVIFGAGSAGKYIYCLCQIHGIKLSAAIDNDPNKRGANLYSDIEHLHFGSNTEIKKDAPSIPIITPAESRRLYPNAVIVLCTGNLYTQNKILEQLTNIGYNRSKIIIPKQEVLIFYTHIPQWYWSIEDIKSKQKDIYSAYNLLADDASKKLFIDRIALFCLGADYASYQRYIRENTIVPKQKKKITTSSENYLYFNNSIIEMTEHETLIDCGAYDGDTLAEFLRIKSNSSIREYSAHCFEPDIINFRKLANSYENYDDVTLYNLGVWSHPETLYFHAGDEHNVVHPTAARVASTPTTTFIKVTSIDEALGKEKPTFIKMDIEGSEIKALIGAKQTIITNKPKLAISAYHRRYDIVDIPLLINCFRSDYKFHLRLCSKNESDVVLFAT